MMRAPRADDWQRFDETTKDTAKGEAHQLFGRRASEVCDTIAWKVPRESELHAHIRIRLKDLGIDYLHSVMTLLGYETCGSFQTSLPARFADIKVDFADITVASVDYEGLPHFVRSSPETSPTGVGRVSGM